MASLTHKRRSCHSKALSERIACRALQIDLAYLPSSLACQVSSQRACWTEAALAVLRLERQLLVVWTWPPLSATPQEALSGHAATCLCLQANRLPDRQQREAAALAGAPRLGPLPNTLVLTQPSKTDLAAGTRQKLAFPPLAVDKEGGTMGALYLAQNQPEQN
eukprot:scaffold2173_cov416-Prasinococcus_capsulatus_cf.AAC.4